MTAAQYHLEAQKVILQAEVAHRHANALLVEVEKLKAENFKAQNSAILDDGYVGDGEEKQVQVELATRGATDDFRGKRR